MGEIKHGIDVFSSLAAPQISLKNLPSICDFYEMYTPSLQWAPLYPRQKTLMKLIFLELDQMTSYDFAVIESWRESTRNNGLIRIPLDIFDRIEWLKKRNYKHFRESVFVLGRRGSKGFTSAHIAGYKVAQMLTLGNPQKEYGIAEGKDLYVDILATTYSQAKSALYLDVLNTIISCSWFDPYVNALSETAIKLETASDKVFNEKELQKQIEAGRRKNIKTRSTIQIEPKAANPDAARGRASFLQMFDEFAYGLDDGLKASSSEIYKALTPSLRQFGKDGMIIVPSTPVSEIGKFYELYCDAFETTPDGMAKNPEMFCIQAPSWELFTDGQYLPAIRTPLLTSPDQDESFRAEIERDPEKSKVEYYAQFAKSENAFLNSHKVDEMFYAFPSMENNLNVPHKTGRLDVQYTMHCDAGRTNDNFCCSIGHKQLCDDGYYHAFIDVQKIFQAKDFEPSEDGSRHIDYVVVFEWLKSILKVFNVTKITFDQWNSGAFIDFLNREKLRGSFMNNSVIVTEETATEKSNSKRWERFKQALNQGWLHAPFVKDDILGLGRVCMLEKELKFLILKNGKKVDHPDNGPVTHNDMADCVSTVCVRLLSEQIDAFMTGNLLPIVGAAQGGYLGQQTALETNDLERFYQDRSAQFEREMGLVQSFGGSTQEWTSGSRY